MSESSPCVLMIVRELVTVSICPSDPAIVVRFTSTREELMSIPVPLRRMVPRYHCTSGVGSPVAVQRKVAESVWLTTRPAPGSSETIKGRTVQNISSNVL